MVGLDFSLSALGNVYETVALSFQDFVFYFLDTIMRTLRLLNVKRKRCEIVFNCSDGTYHAVIQSFFVTMWL